jgi:hypothetical protein
MPKMDEVVVNVRHMEDLLDRFYGTWRDMFAEYDTGSRPVWNLS